jgi:uncharacterized protein involved in response to NO
MIQAPAASITAGRWRWRNLLLATHRLAFFLATVVLLGAALWWALVQLERSGAGPHLPLALSPTLVHAAVMTFGFIPLFFAGFLFTAGPRWLHVNAPAPRQVAPSLLVQGGGWLLWLAGSHVHPALAGAGLLLALGGMVAVTLRFWRLIAASRLPDRLHPKLVGAALVVGCLCLAGLAGAQAAGADGAARAFILAGLWGFVVFVYLTVAHRMIPFLGSDALPMARAWSSWWLLWWMLGAALFEAAAAVLEATGIGSAGWRLTRGLLELVAGAAVVWVALAWGRAQNVSIRLLAMLRLGFLWLGVGLALGGATQLASLADGAPVLPLAALHAVTLGCLGSLMLAMVTRVSCAHSGRVAVVDDRLWLLFWLLQLATVLRIAATVPALPGQALLLAAALLWAGLLVTWGVRHGYWYGCPRADGRPG